MPRPKGPAASVIGCRLPQPIYRQLRSRAIAEDRSISTLVRRAVEQLLANDGAR